MNSRSRKEEHMRNIVILFFVVASLLCMAQPAFAEPLWRMEEQYTINALSVAEDGSKLAVGTQDATAVVLAADGTQLFEFAANNVVTGVALLRDGRLAVSSDDQHLYMIGPDGRTLWDLNFKRMVKALSAASGGSVLAVSTFRSKDVVLLNDQGETLGTASAEIDIQKIGVSPKGTWIAAAAADQYAYVFDAAGALQRKIPAVGDIVAIDVSDDALTAVGTSENKVYFYDEAGSLLGSMETKDVITAVKLSADGKYAAVADYSGNYYVTDAKGNELWSTKEAGPGRQAAFSSNGMLYTASGDGAVYAYNVESILESGAKSARMKQGLQIGGIAGGALAVVLGLWWTARYKPHILRRLWKDKLAYFMLAPSFALVFLFLYYPSFSGLYHSLFDWNPGGRSEFVGLANFRRMFNDPYVTKGVGNLLILIVTGLIKTIVPPLLVAELIYHLKSKKSQYVFRTAFVISMVVPSVGMLLVWQDMYDPSMGFINQFLELIGLGALAHPWLGDPNTALWAVIFMGFPFVGILQLLVLYSGLISISDEVIEAAKIDGAKTFRIIRSIHLPLLAGQFKLLIVLALIGIMQDFGSILIVTGGGPADSTYVPALQMYFAATKFNDLGYASALGVSMFVIILLITIVNMKLIKSNAE